MDTHKIPGGAHLAHAYIAASMNEGARRDLAMTLAGALVCSAEGEARPCGHCQDCRKAAAGMHPDIVIVNSGTDSKGRARREITVDIVREMVAAAQVVPNEAQRKVFVVEDADTMNRQAQNAMLKLLEEPPLSAAFVLCVSNPLALLDTVRSRCEIVRANADADEDPEAKSDAAELLAAAAKDRAGFLLWCSEHEGMDSRRCEAMLRAAREALADVLIGRGKIKLDAGQCARLDALFERCGVYLRQNVAVKSVLSLIAVDGIQK